MRKVISSICLKNNKILLVKKRDTWILPGGKPNKDESDLACLRRELEEELPHATAAIGKFYQEIIGRAPYRGDQITCRVYFAEIEGEIIPGAEITNANFFSLDELGQMAISDVTEQIIIALVKSKRMRV